MFRALGILAWTLLGLMAATGMWAMFDRSDWFGMFLCAVVWIVASCQAGDRVWKWRMERR